jgi:hypothetical protein
MQGFWKKSMSHYYGNGKPVSLHRILNKPRLDLIDQRLIDMMDGFRA